MRLFDIALTILFPPYGLLCFYHYLWWRKIVRQQRRNQETKLRLEQQRERWITKEKKR